MNIWLPYPKRPVFTAISNYNIRNARIIVSCTASLIVLVIVTQRQRQSSCILRLMKPFKPWPFVALRTVQDYHHFLC